MFFRQLPLFLLLYRSDLQSMPSTCRQCPKTLHNTTGKKFTFWAFLSACFVVLKFVEISSAWRVEQSCKISSLYDSFWLHWLNTLRLISSRFTVSIFHEIYLFKPSFWQKIPVSVAAVSEVIEDGSHLVVGDVEPNHVQHVLHLVQGDVVLPRQCLGQIHWISNE